MSPSPTQHLEIEIDTRELMGKTGNIELTVKTHFKRFWLTKLGLRIMTFGVWIIGVNKDKITVIFKYDEL